MKEYDTLYGQVWFTVEDKITERVWNRMGTNVENQVSKKIMRKVWTEHEMRPMMDQIWSIFVAHHINPR